MMMMRKRRRKRRRANRGRKPKKKGWSLERLVFDVCSADKYPALNFKFLFKWEQVHFRSPFPR
jgi:hypothetical protein